jgi:hypothetical protein
MGLIWAKTSWLRFDFVFKDSVIWQLTDSQGELYSLWFDLDNIAVR